MWKRRFEARGINWFQPMGPYWAHALETIQRLSAQLGTARLPGTRNGTRRRRRPSGGQRRPLGVLVVELFFLSLLFLFLLLFLLLHWHHCFGKESIPFSISSVDSQLSESSFVCLCEPSCGAPPPPPLLLLLLLLLLLIHWALANVPSNWGPHWKWAT